MVLRLLLAFQAASKLHVTINSLFDNNNLRVGIFIADLPLLLLSALYISSFFHQGLFGWYGLVRLGLTLPKNGGLDNTAILLS